MNLNDLKLKLNLDNLTFNRLRVRVMKLSPPIKSPVQELTNDEYAFIVQLISRLPNTRKAEPPKKSDSANPQNGKDKAPFLPKSKEKKTRQEKMKPEDKTDKKGQSNGKDDKASKSKAPDTASKEVNKRKKLTRDQVRDLEARKRQEKKERELRAQFMKSLLTVKKKKKKKKKKGKEIIPDNFKNIKTVPTGQTVSSLAEILGQNPSTLLEKLKSLGENATINQQLDDDVAFTIASEFEQELKFVNAEELMNLSKRVNYKATFVDRPPIVTVMGHVDHGKTTLLDVIRKTKVIDSEVGGITQKIGAYQVEVKEHKITFIDTPGHEAFTAMRVRGAKITDIVVLVVAADDGVKPQTVEAINHAKAANVPIIVAINKIDKPGINIDLVKKQLSEHGLVPEDWSGNTPFVNISAKNMQGIDELLDYILLQAEMLELKADPYDKATGTVIEARIVRGRGPVAAIIVENGTLKKGDNFVCGNVYGKVRQITNELGAAIATVGPTMSAELVGFSELPLVGDKFEVVDNEKIAKNIVSKRIELFKVAKTSVQKPNIDMDKFLEEGNIMEINELKLIIKADALGSVEAIVDSLMKFSNEEVKLNIIHSGVGAVNESDVMLAAASDSTILVFATVVNAKARGIIDKEHIDIRKYNIIYDLIEDIQKYLDGMKKPVYIENLLGTVEVRKVFSVSRVGRVAGCYVKDGLIARSKNVRVVRNDAVVHEGIVKEVKRFKDDVKEVKKGYECGVFIENFNDIHEGDILEIFEKTEK